MPDWVKGLLGFGAGGAALGIPSFFQEGRDFLFGKDAELKPFDLQSPEQMGLQRQLIDQLGGSLPGLLRFFQQFTGDDEESFRQYAAPHMRHFETNVIPTITERFGGGGVSGMGESGASSGLFNALGEAGKGLEESLASSRKDQGLRAAALQSGLFQPALQQTRGFQNIGATPGSAGDIMKLLPALLALL